MKAIWTRRFAVLAAGVVTTVCLSAQAPSHSAQIEVTAGKVPEDVMRLPQSVTVVTADDLRARGVRDLAGALAFVAGVSVAEGGDAGPAGSVPEMWGIREADAFLLVVDGVPWGGAFNPDLPSLDMTGVERIEVVRGPAPVMYGATSFIGVIHVVTREAGSPGAGRASIGSYSSGMIGANVPLSQSSAFRQSITGSHEHRGFEANDTGFDRTHILYRSATTLAAGKLRFDVDGVRLRQEPGSPHPREGRVLSPRVALDANHNPRGARLDSDSIRAILGYETGSSIPWVTTLSLGRTEGDVVRGFLSTVNESATNAAGYAQDRSVNDVYFDTHVVARPDEALRIIAGLDHMYGGGRAESSLFHYHASLSGNGRDVPSADREELDATDHRNFSGLYAQGEWMFTPSLRFDLGARLNRTSERRTVKEEDGVTNRSSRTDTRASGGAGLSWQVLDRATASATLFANIRSTFKPAAFDFAPEGEADILEPETGRSAEVGVRGVAGRFSWEASTFRNDLTNLLVSTVRNGLPARENAGAVKVNGADAEVRASITDALRAELAWAYHDARFGDYEQAFDGVPTQLSGHRFEMSPLHSGGVSLVYAPDHGFTGHAGVNYIGERYLNKRNTAIADAFTTISAGIGFRTRNGEWRVDGRNLTNERDAVAESELGDAQYYRLVPRSIDVSYSVNF